MKKTNKTKKIIVEFEGSEDVRHFRKAILEVPEDMGDGEIECIDADHFDEVPEQSSWEKDESFGIAAVGYPEFIGEAAEDAEPEAIVYRDEYGEYRVRPNEKFVQ